MTDNQMICPRSPVVGGDCKRAGIDSLKHCWVHEREEGCGVGADDCPKCIPYVPTAPERKTT